MNIYAVYDKVAESYSEPFPSASHEVAKRDFRYTVRKYDDFLIKDLVLFWVGNFDKISGELISVCPLQIDTGETYLNELKAQELIEAKGESK